MGMFVAHDGRAALRDSRLNLSVFTESVLLCPDPEETLSAVKVDAGDAGLLGIPAEASSSEENNRVSLGGLKCAGRGGGEYVSKGSIRSVGVIASGLMPTGVSTGFSPGSETSLHPPVEFALGVCRAVQTSIAFAEMFVLALDSEAATSDCLSFSA